MYPTYIFFIISVLLVPPKPNELDSITSNFFDCVEEIIFRFCEYSSGFSKLILGAIKSFFIISTEYTISLAPAIQHSCPVIDLVDDMGVLCSVNIESNAIASAASP